MNIAILEDDKEYHLIIKSHLNKLGYEKIVAFESLQSFKDYNDIAKIDLLIADYFFGQGVTLVDLLQSNNLSKKTKVIVITNYFEEAVYEDLLKYRPLIFLKKGFVTLELKNAIYAANMLDNKARAEFINNQFFVKVGSNLKPVKLKDICYFEVENKYVNITTLSGRVFIIRSTLTELENKLPDNFIRVHAAYMVNKELIENVSLDEKHVVVNGKSIPYSRTYKKSLFNSLVIT